MSALPFQQNYGLVRRGVVDSYDSSTNKMVVMLNNNNGSSNFGMKAQTSLIVPFVIASNNGLFIGSKPVKGTPVAVVQGEGNEGYLISFLPQGKSFDKFFPLDDNEIVISGTKRTAITVNTSDEISLGGRYDRIKISTPNKQIDTYISSTIDNEYKFSQSEMSISGLIRREYTENFNYVDSDKLKNDDYLIEMKTIGIDDNHPISIYNNSTKNPPLVEKRNVIYETVLDSNPEEDSIEKNIYSLTSTKTEQKIHNDRRNSRANTFNLNIYNPNALIEEINGTATDMFGNILDINRNKIILDNHFTSQGDNSKTFLNIKKQERKSIAHHFEINSRKDLNNVADYSDNTNFGRHRSNFSFDVDKEGLFKLNIPASTNDGNVPILTRNINSSALTEEPNGLIVTDSGIDLQLDGFATGPDSRRSTSKSSGVITVSSNSPTDRILDSLINYGTAYHDLLYTCFTSQSTSYLDYLNTSNSGITLNNTPTTNIDNGLNGLPFIKNIISNTITIGTNSGGRSGSVNLDGSIDINIGANTSDKQSIILDTEGGIIGNIGKDIRGISTSLSLDGAMLISIGGGKISGDPRFTELLAGGVLDIRTINSGGDVHIIRIDDYGCRVSSAGRLDLHARHGMNLTSDGTLTIDAEVVSIQGRLFLKETGESA